LDGQPTLSNENLLLIGFSVGLALLDIRITRHYSGAGIGVFVSSILKYEKKRTISTGVVYGNRNIALC
jgi:hypothetical protein